ncbi:beta-1,6-N-acetylglucosaminyltransferase [Methylotenera sp. 1P/1]|uniref:beta-1,6-N-acetylglucosaminyltransferase n=1 Tax=Methylotenera sp. 1P/1 TaxID=1131551 RepID=UPI00037B5641|nr:beta-1,6-N-acetylglucosaminyltransferase [Methylotenera sp. 1P/1]
MIAYLILVHRYPEQFKRMFKAIHHPLNHYLIHIDKTSGPEISKNIQMFLNDYPNAELLKPEKALWGGYSLVNIELRGMARLLQINQEWTHFINLSGQDFPLKTQKFIRSFLTENPNKEYIQALDQLQHRPDTMHRVLDFCYELGSKIFRPNIRRKFLKGVTPYIGTQWMIVSRRFCEFAATSKESQRYKSFYKNSFIADEGFFQTVMMNNNCHGDVIQDDLRFIDWIPDGDIKLRPRTFTYADSKQLTSSHNLFARKFDSTEDDAILDEIESYLSNSPNNITTACASSTN